jgi:Glyoxalase-like domain
MNVYPLDHAVISVRDQMDHAVDLYTRMGFTVTHRGVHRVGSINHLMVFDDDYLELIGFPAGGEHLRPDLTEAPIGLDGLVLRPDSAKATYTRLTDAGYSPAEPSILARPVLIDGKTEEARFATVRFPRGAVAGGRLYFCEHLTPQFVWRDEWLTHANTAQGIEAFTIATPDPHAEAARYQAMIGVKVALIEDERVLIELRGGALDFITPSALTASLGDAMCDPRGIDGKPRESFMAAVTIRVANLATTARVLGKAGVPTRKLDARTLAVPARAAMNCTIIFASR